VSGWVGGCGDRFTFTITITDERPPFKTAMGNGLGLMLEGEVGVHNPLVRAEYNLKLNIFVQHSGQSLRIPMQTRIPRTDMHVSG